ncbi:AAA family ATPase [Janibacter sp. YIM B02568]|uniref:AAA family ATPase n=1 Tax=Janibacter endophyticus TaxID=2806261 RepID=UPI0019526335|nr:AAA family ATPase [Janibacter endophyticus]MBM6545928.1 AAA family ATPase [Janibacter endophyticus]
MSLPCPRRVLVTGAAGAGTTTLASALAARWSVPHADTDDYFWLPTDPPYREVREVSARVELMSALFLPRPVWVLSGSLLGWGDPARSVMERVELVVLVTLEPSTRMARVEERQRRRYGSAAIAEGGPLHDEHVAFLQWCAGYDDPDFDGRNLAGHLAWLEQIEQPSLRLDGSAAVGDLVAQVASHLCGARP